MVNVSTMAIVSFMLLKTGLIYNRLDIDEPYDQITLRRILDIYIKGYIASRKHLSRISSIAVIIAGIQFRYIPTGYNSNRILYRF